MGQYYQGCCSRCWKPVLNHIYNTQRGGEDPSWPSIGDMAGWCSSSLLVRRTQGAELGRGGSERGWNCWWPPPQDLLYQVAHPNTKALNLWQQHCRCRLEEAHWQASALIPGEGDDCPPKVPPLVVMAPVGCSDGGFGTAAPIEAWHHRTGL